MVLVLTYHRIVERIEHFLDVTPEELDRHIRTLKRVWPVAAAVDLSTLNAADDAKEPQFLITFDDGTPDHLHNAVPVVERNGVRGAFFVSTSLLGTDGHLSASECQELQQRGHAVESHAHEHTDLRKLAPTDLSSQLRESRRILMDLGLGRGQCLAVPGGYFDEDVVSAAKECGFTTLRTVRWGCNRGWDPFRVESFIINRKTCGRLFEPLISPRFELAKKAAYGARELLKDRLSVL